MKRAASYARYSSDRQNERSIEDQFAFNRTIAARHGLTIVVELSDRALSGAATINRPGFLEAMRLAEAGAIDLVLVEDQNRAFRNEADYHMARARLDYFGVGIHNANGIIGRVEGSFFAMMDAMTLDKLAAQTRRGMQGVARAGKSAGGRAYGYRPVKGEPGVLSIDEAEAEIVRRIFAAYVAGDSPRTIAIALNRDGVPSPRGGEWRGSTIAGHRGRQSGILFNPLYDGRSIWNRLQFRKHPDTRKRLPRANDRSEWIEAKVEALRIVDRQTFAAAQRRKDKRAGSDGDARRPSRNRYLLSGLVKCGACGGNFTASAYDKRGVLMACARAREADTCSHKRRLPIDKLESQVLQGIADYLGNPDKVKAYVKRYHEARARERAGAARKAAELQRRLDQATREGKQLVDAIAKGTGLELVRDRLIEIENERAALKAALAAQPPAPIALHPGAAEAYRRIIANLKDALSGMTPVGRDAAFAIIRETVEKIVVKPGAPYKPVELEIHGRLAKLLQISEPGVDHTPRSGVQLVAGEGFEPPTSGL